MASSIILLVFAAVVSSSYGTDLPIPSDADISISYRIIGNRIEFTLVSDILPAPIPNTGRWVGIGFSRTEGMSGADVFMGVPTATTETGRGRDLYTNGHRVDGRDDPSNDWTVHSASNDDVQARVVASRLLDTGDTERDLVIEDRSMSIIYASGYSLNDDVWLHGGYRGQLYFNLIGEYQDDGSTTTGGPTAEPSTAGPTTTGNPGETSSPSGPIIEPVTGTPTTVAPSTSGPSTQPSSTTSAQTGSPSSSTSNPAGSGSSSLKTYFNLLVAMLSVTRLMISSRL